MLIFVILIIIALGAAAFYFAKRSSSVDTREPVIEEKVFTAEIEPLPERQIEEKSAPQPAAPQPAAPKPPAIVVPPSAAAPAAQPSAVDPNLLEVGFEIAPEFRGKHVMERKAAAEFMVQEWLVAHPEYRFVSGPTLVIGRKYVAKFARRNSAASAS